MRTYLPSSLPSPEPLTGGGGIEESARLSHCPDSVWHLGAEGAAEDAEEAAGAGKLALLHSAVNLSLCSLANFKINK